MRNCGAQSSPISKGRATCSSSGSPDRSAWARARPRPCSARAACRSTTPTRRCTASTRGGAVAAVEAAFPGVAVDGAIDRARLCGARARRRRGARAARGDRASAGARERGGLPGANAAPRGAAWSSSTCRFSSRRADRTRVRCDRRRHRRRSGAARARAGPAGHDEAKLAAHPGAPDARRGEAPPRAFRRRFRPRIRGRRTRRWTRSCARSPPPPDYPQRRRPPTLAIGGEAPEKQAHARDRLRHRNDGPRLPERRPADRDRLRRAPEPHSDRAQLPSLRQSAPHGFAGSRRSCMA